VIAPLPRACPPPRSTRNALRPALAPVSSALGAALASILAALTLITVASSCGDVTTDLITRDPNAPDEASSAGNPNVALECQRDDDCPSERRRCDLTDNRCVACLDAIDCGEGQTCNLPSHTCVLLCTAGAVCAGASPYCDEATGACRGCRAEGECQAPTPHCDVPSGRCVQCLALADCEDDEARLCSPTGRCVECLTNGHCEEEAERCSSVLGECGIPCTGPGTCPFDDPVCDVAVGFCVECSEDSDCGPEGVCRNFDCVESDEDGDNTQDEENAQND
jgi:hypothetical protein